jgi:hypothetical protein
MYYKNYYLLELGSAISGSFLLQGLSELGALHGGFTVDLKVLPCLQLEVDGALLGRTTWFRGCHANSAQGQNTIARNSNETKRRLLFCCWRP